MTSERLRSSRPGTSPLVAERGWAPPLPPDGAAVGAVAPDGGQIRLDPDNVRNGLVRLVLTLVELLRELLERQALRRIDGGSLSGGRRSSGWA